MHIINPADVMPPQSGFSQGIRVRDLVFVAGQVGGDARGQLAGDGGMEAQTRQTIANVASVLREAGATLADVVSATVYVANFAEYKHFDRVWQECFGTHRPARATVRAELVLPVLLVEIQAIAVRPHSD